MKILYSLLLCFLLLPDISQAQTKSNPDFFPIAVWCQNPRNAEAYKEMGINMFLALDGVDEGKLDKLRAAGMKVIIEQNEFGLKHLKDTLIYAWMQMDEPDNSQATSKGYGPPVKPDTIISRYYRMKAKDPSRPVYLGLGKGVADPDWVGRGVDCHKTDMYPKYLKGGDIVSYDIYPVNAGYKLWYVPKGVDSLLVWSENKKPVWCTIEATNYNNTKMPSLSEIKSEVWMALVHGATGFDYFCHQFKPTFIEGYPLTNPSFKEGLTGINHQITSLARVLNSPSIADYASVSPENKDVPVDMMAKKSGKNHYLFAVGMREGSTAATFNVKSGSKVEVLGENRTLKIKKGKFTDVFAPYAVHLYKIK
jgi:hypothetical protein